MGLCLAIADCGLEPLPRRGNGGHHGAQPAYLVLSPTGSVYPVQRVLDIDVDFFVEPTVYDPDGDDDRPDPAEHTVWSAAEALGFLRERCGLVGRGPGFLTETHDQLFGSWRNAIAAGILKPPFHVTHVDGHADLGLGYQGHEYLMTNLLFQARAARAYPSPSPGEQGLTQGTWLLYAIACRWLNDLTYVHLDNENGGAEAFTFILNTLKPGGDAIQLRAMTPEALSHWALSGYADDCEFAHIEPEVPYEVCLWSKWQAEQPYDFVCLTRSPQYAPLTADPLYELIAETFIDPIA